MILSIIVGAVFVWLVWDVRKGARQRRNRDDLRHVIGSQPWWGQR